MGPVPAAARAWSIEPVEALAGYNVEHAEADGRLIVSRGHSLYLHKPDHPLWNITHLPLPPWQQAAQAMGVSHTHFDNVVPLSGRTALLTYGRRVYAMHDGIARPLLGLVRPTAVYRGGCAVRADGVVFFGECNRNRKRGPVHIYRWDPTQPRVDVAYTFPSQSVRGVYTVYANPEDDALWVCTGDIRGECRILRTDDGFRSLEVIGAGDESWRAVNVHPSRGKMCYASAGERLLNRVYRVDPTNGNREDMGEIGGPVRDSVAIEDDIIFAVQGSRCNCNPEGEAALWHLDASNGLHKLFKGCQTRDRGRHGIGFSMARAPDGGFWFSTRDPYGHPVQTFYAHRRGKN